MNLVQIVTFADTQMNVEVDMKDFWNPILVIALLLMTGFGFYCFGFYMNSEGRDYQKAITVYKAMIDHMLIRNEKWDKWVDQAVVYQKPEKPEEKNGGKNEEL